MSKAAKGKWSAVRPSGDGFFWVRSKADPSNVGLVRFMDDMATVASSGIIFHIPERSFGYTSVEWWTVPVAEPPR